MSTPKATKQRPWTVTVLLAWALAGLVWDLFSADRAPSTWVSGFGPLLAGLIAFGAWRAKRWAFTLMLAATLFLAVIVLPATYFLQNEAAPTLVVPTISIIGQLILLFHPATRTYATQDLAVNRRPEASVQESPAQPLGVRRNTVVALVFLLAAIAIAGTLGVIRIYQMTG